MFARLTVAALAAFALLVPSAAAAGDRPNIVVVMTDDQDFRSMSAMPQTRKLIARRGTTFDTNVVNFPLCCPSRATFLTGQYAHNHGIQWNNAPDGGYYALDQAKTLPVWLSRAGYETIHIGKYLNEYGERDPHEVPRGWDQWWGGVDPSTYDYYGYTLNHNGSLRTYGTEPGDYSTDVYADIAAREIRRAADDRKPFFLNLAPLAPHTVAVESAARMEGTPAVPAPRDLGAYADAELPPWPNFNEADISDKPAVEAFFPAPMDLDTIASLTEHYRGRMASLLAVDDLVARVGSQLRRAGVAEGHGRHLHLRQRLDPRGAPDPRLRHRGRAGVGREVRPFEGSSRVPLMIAGPGFPERRTVRSPTVNADLAPTILDLADADAGLPPDGVSLRRVARNPDRFADRSLLIETFANPRGIPPYAAVRTRRYRYERSELGARRALRPQARPVGAPERPRRSSLRSGTRRAQRRARSPAVVRRCELPAGLGEHARARRSAARAALRVVVRSRRHPPPPRRRRSPGSSPRSAARAGPG